MRKVDSGVKIGVRTLVRWSWLLIACVIVGVVVGRAITVILPPQYQSTAIVQLRSQTRDSQTQIIQPIAAYSTLITSDPVLNPVLKNYPYLDRATFVSKNLVVTPDTPSQSLQVQVTLPNAKAAADIANTLARLLVTQQNTYIKTQYEKALQLVNKRIAAEQQTIDHLNQQYAATPATNTATLSQLDSQLQQQRTLQNADIATQQSLLTERTLYNDPLSVVLTGVAATRPSSLMGMIPFVPLMGSLFFVLGLFAIALLEQRSGHIHGVYTLQQKTGLPIVGSLRWADPLLLSAPLGERCEGLSPRYLEDCRIMMANVLFQAEQANARTIAITSLRSEAGTSTVAVQLAALLAQSKHRVLLIDANLYQPALHEMARVPNEAGLVRMLEGVRRVPVTDASSGSMAVDVIDRLPLDAFVKTTDISELYLLPAGQPPAEDGSPDPLDVARMRQCLDATADSVDFVLIDCPSLDHSDTHLLGTLCDQTLIVVDATRDRIQQVVDTKNGLSHTGIKVAGLIVNKLGRWF